MPYPPAPESPYFQIWRTPVSSHCTHISPHPNPCFLGENKSKWLSVTHSRVHIIPSDENCQHQYILNMIKSVSTVFFSTSHNTPSIPKYLINFDFIMKVELRYFKQIKFYEYLLHKQNLNIISFSLLSLSF